MSKATLDLLLKIMGSEAVDVLIEHCGGLDVDVPLHVPFRGKLSCLPEAAQTALASYAGGTSLYVPKNDAARRATRNAAIVAAYAAGEKVQALAMRYKLTERSVYMIVNAEARARARARDTHTLSLF